MQRDGNDVKKSVLPVWCSQSELAVPVQRDGGFDASPVDGVRMLQCSAGNLLLLQQGGAHCRRGAPFCVRVSVCV